jgi:hypothetical protein
MAAGLLFAVCAVTARADGGIPSEAVDTMSRVLAAYAERDADAYLDCLSEDFLFVPDPDAIGPFGVGPLEPWGKARAEAIHRRMFSTDPDTPEFWDIDVQRWGPPFRVEDPERSGWIGCRFNVRIETRIRDQSVRAESGHTVYVQAADPEVGSGRWKIVRWEEDEDTFDVEPPPECEEPLIWSIRIEDETVWLEDDCFDTMRQFPTDHVRIIRVVDSSQYAGEELRLDLRLETAPVYVNIDGTLEAGDGSPLGFFPTSRVSGSSANRTFEVLTLPGEEDRVARIPARHISLLDLPGQKVLGWELLSPDGPALVHTSHQTFFFRAGDTESPGPPPSRTYMHRTHSVVASVASGRSAAVAMEAREEAPALGPMQQMLVVFDPDGRVILETDPEGVSYDQLHLTPSGETLVFRRTSQQGDSETVALDVGSGRSSRGGIIDGIRYYSRDGTRMVVIQTGLGTAVYYDVTEPFNPMELWSYQADDFIVTAAVCDDGSLLALQILNAEGNPTRVTKRVVVLDDSMRKIHEPITDGDQVDMAGLEWDGKFLFVGTQRHPLPVPVNFRTTERIDIYDYSQQWRRP